MMTLRSLIESRTKITAEMKGLLATAGEADLQDEARTRFETLRTEADTLQTRIERQATVDDLERRAVATPLGGSNDQRLDNELRNFSVVRAIAGAAGLAVDWGREREIGTEFARRSGRSFAGICVPLAALTAPVEHRVLTTTLPAGGPGSNIISTNLLADQTIDRLRAQLVIKSLGARVLSGLVGNVAIPRLKGSASAYWVQENSPVTESDPQVDQATLTPKTVGAMTEFSRLLLLQSSPDVEQLVRGDLTAVLAQALDLAAIAGTGASSQPRGILNTAGIGSIALAANGAPISFDNIVDLMGQTQDANAESNNAFLTNYKVRRQVMKIKDTTNQPLGESVLFQNMPRAFTTNVPSNLSKGTSNGILSALIYGDFSQLLVGLWSEIDLLINPYDTVAYPKGNVIVRAMSTVDVTVRHPESFAAIQDIAA